MTKIAILLSTYNSSKYLRELLDSIINQTITNWTLFIRDDGSTDSTLQIIQEYYLKNPEKITLISDNIKKQGAGKSFMHLLSIVDAQYYMFCDHDDIWLPAKIEKTISKLNEIELLKKEEPILIFTDMKVVDENLNIINKSMWNFQKTKPEYSKNIYTHAVSNSVSGCTMMINRKAKELAFPYPQEAFMHDWWITLKIAYYGTVDYVNEATVLYRQHSENVIGAKRLTKKIYLNKLFKLREVFLNNLLIIKALRESNIRVNYLYLLIIKIKTIISKFIK